MSSTAIRHMRWAAPLPWALAGFWIWAPPIVFVWVWSGAQARLGWRLATLESLSTWAALIVSRWTGIWLYNQLVARWAPLTWREDQGQVSFLPVTSNLAAMATLALPFGVLVGFLGNFWGWTVVIPERWWMFPASLFVAAWLYALGSLALYNHVVLRWRGIMALRVRCQAGDSVVVEVAARLLFFSIAWMVFAWCLVVILVVWIVGGSLLAILAQHFPAGFFGFEVEVFVAVGGGCVAYGLGVLLGLWYALGVRILGWRQMHRGPVAWGHTRDEVTT